MLQVLHCIYDDPANPWVGGGGAVRVRELYRHLRERVSATVITGRYPGAEDETIDGIRYVRLGASRPYAWSRWTFARAASRFLREAEYDAAVFDFSVYTPIRIPRDRPVGITVHHVTSPTARTRWGPAIGIGIQAVERRLLGRARWLSATSHATLAELRRVTSADAHISLVGAGVPDRLFEVERNEQDYLLYFGRLDWFQKGLDTLLEALAKLVRERPSLQLRIAGRGKDARRVESYARELGIIDHLRMLGEVSDAERVRLFSGAKLLLMPSRFEGFGMVAAEAMAAAVPLIAADAGSLPEVVAAPEGGVLVPPGDASALAAATLALLDDSPRRAALSHSARRSAERFRWNTVAEDHLEFLRLIAGSRPSVSPSRIA